MKVKVTKTMKGSPDGLTVNEYLEGQTYEMPFDLATVFIREGWGTSCEVEPSEKPEVKAKERKPKAPAEAPAPKPMYLKNNRGGSTVVRKAKGRR